MAAQPPRRLRPITDRPPSSPAQETLRRLEERLEQASDAAERLVAQAAAEASARIGDATVKPPPAGWQSADRGDRERSVRAGGDVEQVLQLLAAVRGLVPPELQQRLAEALRQLLLAVRALLDWYLERLEERRQAPVEVQDIPVM
jgi:hypothetical protein